MLVHHCSFWLLNLKPDKQKTACTRRPDRSSCKGGKVVKGNRLKKKAPWTSYMCDAEAGIRVGKVVRCPVNTACLIQSWDLEPKPRVWWFVSSWLCLTKSYRRAAAQKPAQPTCCNEGQGTIGFCLFCFQEKLVLQQQMRGNTVFWRTSEEVNAIAPDLQPRIGHEPWANLSTFLGLVQHL